MAALDISEQSPFAAIGVALVQNVEAAVPTLRAMSESRHLGLGLKLPLKRIALEDGPRSRRGYLS